MEPETMATLYVKERVSLPESLALKVATGFVEEIHFHFSVNDQEKLLGWLNPRTVLNEMGVGRDHVSRGKRHQADLQGPISFGDEVRSGTEIIRGEHEGINLVPVSDALHVVFEPLSKNMEA